MRTSTEDVTPSERMKALERKAQAIRTRLLDTIDALDTRRHQLARVGSYAKKVAKPAALPVVGLVVLCGVGAVAMGLVARSRRKHRLASRVSRVLTELELVPKPSLGSRIVERVGVTVLTFAVTELVKRSLKGVAFGHDRALESRSEA